MRSTLAPFFHAELENPFLVPNFSFGFNPFLAGLSGDQSFRLLQEDYPSTTYHVRNRSFAYDEITVDENLESNTLSKIELFRPRLLALSLVQYQEALQSILNFLRH